MENVVIEVVNMEVVNNMRAVTELIPSAFTGEYEVKTVYNEPIRSSSRISVIGDIIEVRDRSAMLDILDYTDGEVEIFPRINGKMQMDFTFYNYTVRLGDN